MNVVARGHTAPNSGLALTHHTGYSLPPPTLKCKKAKGNTEWWLLWRERPRDTEQRPSLHPGGQRGTVESSRR